MRRSLVILLLVLAAALSACGRKDAAGEPGGAGTSEPDVPPAVQQATADGEARPAEPPIAAAEDVLAFLDGAWSLYDQDEGADYATLTFSGGACRFVRASDGLAAEGTLTLDAADGPGTLNGFALTMREIPDGFYPAGYGRSEDGGAGTAGRFYVTSFDGTDYLYLQEIGNGVSEVASFLLNPHPERGGDPDETPLAWVLRRESQYRLEGAPRTDDTFRAWIWKQSEDGGLWLQEMTEHTEEAYAEFTNRHYLSAVFAPAALSSARYEIDRAAAEPEKLLSAGRFDVPGGCPLLMAQVRTDTQGRLVELAELDAAEYGAYDLAALPAKFGCDGTDFYYNDARFDVTDYGASNAIMNCTEAGDWIVVEGHVNPKVGEYLFFSKGTGAFEYEIYGADLIWRDGDLSTAVYLFYNEVYTFTGDLVGAVTDGEAHDLSFGDDGRTVVVSCWKLENGDETDFTVEFELPEEHDAAMFAYGEYLLDPRASKWRAFAELASTDDVGLVMVDPPAYILSHVNYDHGDDDSPMNSVVFAALRDGTALRLDEGAPDVSARWRTSGEGPAYYLEKGRCLRFSLAVPEGVPSQALHAEADGLSGVFPVTTLSGESPRHSMFLTRS